MPVVSVGAALPVSYDPSSLRSVGLTATKELFDPFCACFGLNVGEATMERGARDPHPQLSHPQVPGGLGSLPAAPLPLTESLLYLAREARGWGNHPAAAALLTAGGGEGWRQRQQQ